jgi:hypothetical protein
MAIKKHKVINQILKEAPFPFYFYYLSPCLLLKKLLFYYDLFKFVHIQLKKKSYHMYLQKRKLIISRFGDGS